MTQPAPLFYRRKQLCAVLNVGRTTLARMLRDDPSFPKPFPITVKGKARGWLVSDIEMWLKNKQEQCEAQLG